MMQRISEANPTIIAKGMRRAGNTYRQLLRCMLVACGTPDTRVVYVCSSDQAANYAFRMAVDITVALCPIVLMHKREIRLPSGSTFVIVLRPYTEAATRGVDGYFDFDHYQLGD